MDKEITLADIMSCLKDQKKEILEYRNEISIAKNESNEKIESFIKIIGNNIKEVRNDVVVLNNIMEEREKGNEIKHKEAEEKQLENERRAKTDRDEMNTRLSRLEEALSKAGLTKSKMLDRRRTNPQKEEERTVLLPEGRNGSVPVGLKDPVSSHEREKEVSNPVSSYVKEKEVSNWSRNVNEELREAAKWEGNTKQRSPEIGRRIDPEKLTKKKPKGMKALRKWFGQESPETSEVSSESDYSENDSMDEKINRKQRNKDRRRRNLDNRKAKKHEAATKASHTIGCQPITLAQIKAQMDITKDDSKAREGAVREFLENYLQFNHEELQKIKILDTKLSAKGDSTVYVVFEDLDTIREIHWRVAEIKNPIIVIRNYIPPQFWRHYMFLNTECTRYRGNYPEMKTQLRFGSRDIEVLVKVKGTSEPYKHVPYEEITDPREIPYFESNIRWTQKTERPVRRKLEVFRQVDDRMETEQLDSGRQTGLARTRSQGSNASSKCNEITSKKARLNADSSKSGAEHETDEEI